MKKYLFWQILITVIIIIIIIVSRELRTSLSSLKVLAETLLDGALNDPSMAQKFHKHMDGETMALIMVIGNSIAIPKPLNSNPLTILFATARTLTGNIAVEINYAAGAHRSALFFTGILLFVLLLIINRLAHFLMREKNIIR